MMIDPLTLAVLKGVTEQALEEVLATFGRLAFSPIITEGRDYGVGLYAPDSGELLMVEESAFPLFVWLGQDAVRGVLSSVDVRTLSAGDVFLINDPYLTGTHMHDVKAVAPIIWRKKLVCFICVTGHWPDIGGPSPGGFATRATQIYQEGLRIPPVRVMSGGELHEDIVAMIMSNIRVPATSMGDLFAQISAIQVGEERIASILRRFGLQTFQGAMREIADAGEGQMRTKLEEIPDGVYRYRDCLDNDGIDTDPIWIDLSMTSVGGELTLDFSESDPPVRGAFNAPRLTTVAACNIALHHAFPDVLLTGGSARPIHVIAGPDVFIGAEFPRACEAYGEVSSRIMDVTLGALWQALPQRAQGGIFGTSSNMSIGGTDPAAGPFIMYAYLGGGQGGSWGEDGLVNGAAAIGIALTPQIESSEQAYPVRFREYALREDSCGLGEFRGGAGVVWEIELLRGEATMSAMADRASKGPDGTYGGTEGAPTIYEIIRRDGTIEKLPHLAKCENYPLKAGDRIRRQTPGGGGLGEVQRRSPDLKDRDILEGYVSAERYEKAFAAPVAEAKANPRVVSKQGG